MNIQKLHGVDGAKEADGLTIIIDILRAATVEACALSRGAKYIIPVETKEEAFALREKFPDYILMGEEHGYKIHGFDYGNSPSEMLRVNIKDKILIHRTSSGTKGLVNATKSKEIIFGSFVTCSAIVAHINKIKPSNVSIVSMDPEDEIFADYLDRKLRGESPNIEETKKKLYEHPASSWFLNPDKKDFLAVDVDIALEIDRFHFFCSVRKDQEYLKTVKEEK